jgi:hypothetical protein
LSKRNSSADVFADSAYRSTEIQGAARSQRLLKPVFIGTPRAIPQRSQTLKRDEFIPNRFGIPKSAGF